MEQYADARTDRKPRGAFYTPEPLARFLTDWAVRTPSDRVLEPSCGEAVFLEVAAKRLTALGAQPHRSQMLGVDLHEASVTRAARRLAQAGVEAELTTADFFDFRTAQAVEVVLGNPPYIRYQGFTGSSRVKAQEAALRAGVRLSSLASSWAAFTVHAATFLSDGGRMGLVLPAELLSVNYAAGVREFLLRRFGRVRLVLFTERVFPDVQEEVVLLLAEDYAAGGSGTDHFELVQVTSARELGDSVRFESWQPATPRDKWTPALGRPAAYEAITTSDAVTTLASWGRLALGAVTGANRFFALTPRRAAELGLKDADLLPLSPPGSQHLRALTLTGASLEELAAQGARTRLFRPGPAPSAAALRYIRLGESLGVDQAYKCRVRSPWWKVPLQEPADLLVTYMNAEGVALCANTARVRHLNSVHGLFLTSEAQARDAAVLALAARSTVTALGAETIGRSYGGGMLKVEPREAAALPVPTLEVVDRAAEALGELLPRATVLLGRRQAGAEAAVRAEVDRILGEAMGCSNEELTEMRVAHRTLVARRRARGRTTAP